MKTIAKYHHVNRLAARYVSPSMAAVWFAQQYYTRPRLIDGFWTESGDTMAVCFCVQNDQTRYRARWQLGTPGCTHFGQRDSADDGYYVIEILEPNA